MKELNHWHNHFVIQLIYRQFLCIFKKIHLSKSHSLSHKTFYCLSIKFLILNLYAEVLFDSMVNFSLRTVLLVIFRCNFCSGALDENIYSQTKKNFVTGWEWDLIKSICFNSASWQLKQVKNVKIFPSIDRATTWLLWLSNFFHVCEVVREVHWIISYMLLHYTIISLIFMSLKVLSFFLLSDKQKLNLWSWFIRKNCYKIKQIWKKNLLTFFFSNPDFTRFTPSIPSRSEELKLIILSFGYLIRFCCFCLFISALLAIINIEINFSCFSYNLFYTFFEI